MTTQISLTGYNESSTLPAGISQVAAPTALTLANSPVTSPVVEFTDVVRNWFAQKDLRSKSAADATITTQPARKPDSVTSSEAPSSPRIGKNPERVLGLKKWVGLILEIGESLLTVELTPLDHDGPKFHADFDLELLAPDDATARPGDIVYLTTRFVRATSGYSTATTQLRMRRAGQWSGNELAEIEDLARERAEYLKKNAY